MKDLSRHWLQRLFETHHHDLHTSLTRKVGCPDAAADVAQDAYLRLLRRQQTEEIQNPLALLFHVAGQLAINERRRSNWHKTRHASDALLFEQPAPDPDPEVMAVLSETEALLRSVIDNMPPRRREVFVLHRFGHHTYPQIAALLGISVATVEKHVSAAMLECRQHLQVTAGSEAEL